MKHQQLSLQHLVRPPNIELLRPPLLVLLHGQGGDENTLFEFASSFDDRFLIVSPRAPYSIFSRSFSWLPPDPENPRLNNQYPRTEQSRSMLLKFINEAARAYRADPAQVYLFGFGQGALLSMSAMVAEPEILAGVVVANGQVPAEIHSIPVPNERYRDFPALVMHGRLDEVHPIEYGHETRDILAALMTQLTYQEYNSGHTLSKESLTGARAWLTQRLNQQGVSFVPQQTFKPPPFKLRLNSVTIGVRNLDRSIAFYSRFLGLCLVERTGNAYAFLGFKNTNHHEIALENVGSQALSAQRNSPGLHHIAFEVPDCLSFARAYKTLTEAGIKVATTDHLIRWALYFADPDRNGLEIFWDTRDQPGKSHLWQGRDLPLEPEKILAILEDNPNKVGS